MATSNSSPVNPNRAAKQLLKELRSGSNQAIRRVKDVLHGYASKTNECIRDTVCLGHCQQVIAHELGRASWSDLKTTNEVIIGISDRKQVPAISVLGQDALSGQPINIANNFSGIVIIVGAPAAGKSVSAKRLTSLDPKYAHSYLSVRKENSPEYPHFSTQYAEHIGINVINSSTDEIPNPPNAPQFAAGSYSTITLISDVGSHSDHIMAITSLIRRLTANNGSRHCLTLDEFGSQEYGRLNESFPHDTDDEFWTVVDDYISKGNRLLIACQDPARIPHLFWVKASMVIAHRIIASHHLMALHDNVPAMRDCRIPKMERGMAWIWSSCSVPDCIAPWLVRIKGDLPMPT